LIESGFFNALIVDLKLPDMTGLELLTRVKETTPRMRKIILTGFPEISSTIGALDEKADAYLIKPFDPENLLHLIEEKLCEQKGELRLTH
jgi:DNA-binding NtrC family response regulator